MLVTYCIPGLIRQRDSLTSQLRELAKQKPRNKTDDALIADITALESSITLTKDELVSIFA